MNLNLAAQRGVGKGFLVLYFLVGAVFVVGSFMEMKTLTVWSNFLLIPLLLLFYWFHSSWPFLPIAAALLLLYVRDIFLVFGYFDHISVISGCYFLAMGLLFLCLLTSVKKSRIHPLELLSFSIMYGFLIYLFISLQEAVEDVFLVHRIVVNTYLLLLMLLVGASFTIYLMKSHLGSLWFLVASSAFMVSEVSLFFKLFILEDFSVNFFYPFFHVIAYYAFAEYGLRRWRTGKLHFF